MKMVDGNGITLYPTNCKMPSPHNHPRPIVLQHELDLFYDTLVVCICSKYKGLNVNPMHATLSHYINDQIQKFVSQIPPTVVNDPIDEIEKTRRNTSISHSLKSWNPSQQCFVLN